MALELQLKNLQKRIWDFVCEQYLVLFFILTTSTKLALLSTWMKLTSPRLPFLYGIIFGLVSIAVVFSPLYFVRKHKNTFAISLALAISFLLFFDTIYFSYFAAIPSVGLWNTLGQTEDILPAIISIIKWWFFVYFLDIAAVMVFRKPITNYFNRLQDRYKLAKFSTSASAVALILTLLLLGLLLIPKRTNSLQHTLDIGLTDTVTTQYYGILTTHLVDIARFISQETTHLSANQQKLVTDWVKLHQPSQTTSKYTGVAKGKNVIMIQIESLGTFVVDKKINGQEVTPNLNQLEKTANYFPNDRFVIGAGHTSDTDYVVNSSFFPLTDSAVFVRYGQDAFSSLPKALIAKGYSAFAYHGYNRNFWNRSVAFASLGYQKFFAQDNYPKGAVINMGLNDGDFLSKTADYIKSQPKPSLSYIVTLSSHTPFETTAQTEALDLKTTNNPEIVNGYLENINYTDRMLGQFFDKLKAENLYEDSLIVVYGDHTPILPSFTAGEVKFNPSTVQQKEVPLFIKLPAETDSKVYPEKGTHLDIMPTILDLLGIKTRQLMFGQSLFANSSNALKVCTDQLVSFPLGNDCNTSLSTEKEMADKIVRYNLSSDLAK